MAGNPKQALDALINPSPLTLGQFALLERIGSPLLDGQYSSVSDTGAGLWLLSLPAAEAGKRWSEAYTASIPWLDALAPAEYSRRLAQALAGITAFYRMLPKPDEGSKKKGPETAGSPSSPNGPAGPTAGA